MGSKAAGVIGGILILLCASGFFALQWFVIMPANDNYASANGTLSLWYLDTQLNITQSSETLLPWDEVILDAGNVTLEDFLVIDAILKTAPVVDVNFWGVMSLPLMICVFILVGMGAVGGILAIAGAGED